ncbi:class I SAM-dependent methyltransferase [Teredinibacter sp. KSP-S5-2]|uniref:class I SAM-dependent methyltransferase n=1 Tax=Teredinibacter sp. KSP-S5-2 TaxID=3034506 RepID=UPI0029353299|nr:class I SAM-dependent methyltransferase [Teredinibacter sp. KSP-S5-2]WNO09278.1 class I SAM-dependent methyltransferase [Teredinibacter sp. KSP-S5-2]
MAELYTSDTKSALEAITDAHKIAFAPYIFQATVALDGLGILGAVDQAKEEGVSVDKVAQQLGLSRYGVSVLLDAGLSIGLVYKQGGAFKLTKAGHFLLHDQMTRVNFEFSRDFSYRGLEKLMSSIQTGVPEGLKEYSEEKTIYPILSSLPEPAKASWFNFDHYFSDSAFPEVLPIIFEQPVKRLLDCGGNTGKFALSCVAYDENVNVTILDLPQQLALMKENIANKTGKDRIDGQPYNFLALEGGLPEGADVIWMSQFLDCFSEEEIERILKKAAAAMSDSTRLCILETFWDRQNYEAAALSINCTSLYFSCFANGNSRMYESDVFKNIVQRAGLTIDKSIDHIGKGHSLVVCRKA